MSHRSRLLAWGFPCVIAAACGARTAEEIATPGDGGIGIPVGAGGQVSQGGAPVGRGGSNPLPQAAGGRVIGPAPERGGSIVIGVAGTVSAGGFGNAGVGNAGAPSDCSSPVCACPDCYSQCTCRLGQIGSLALCNGMCFGAGGAPSTGRVPGAGGSTFQCTEEGGITACAPPPLPLPACCSNDECGYFLDLSGNANIPIEGGCQAYGQPGVVDPRCPDLGTLMYSHPVGVPGCCRPDGTCGVALDTIGLGCVGALVHDQPFRCDRPQSVDAGRD
jgi:hypothetical protein